MVREDGRALVIASRGSQLALWQANHVRDALMNAHPQLVVEIRIIRTIGDKILDVPLAKIGDKGLFTKELDHALLDRSADLAVHSLKDIPTRLPAGLQLAAVTEREDPRDVLIARSGVPASLSELPAGARVGTSSLRRRAQLRAVRPEVEVLDLRGNLNTRLARLDSGDYEAIILAAAGVVRLGWSDRISQYLEHPGWLPAVGQGALGIVTRAGDEAVSALLHPLEHSGTTAAVRAERTFLNRLEGGCQVPIAALAQVEGEELSLQGLVADLDGRRILRDDARAPLGGAEELGARLAAALVARGATEILDEVRRAAGTPPVSQP
jgi:hydroxymethylbilane synthase